MPLAKSITPKIINVLGVQRFAFSFILIAFCIPVFSQDNSPYSRYGLGDLVPTSNVNSRGMGGISAGYNEFLAINFNNPASFGAFQTFKEPSSKRISYGRAILDAGITIDNRTLREPNTIEKFSSSNALFSHLQVGVPLRPNWGLSFGLRPMTRISYKMNKSERLFDPNSGQPIDSSITLNEGDGGSYLASLGTGFRVVLNDKQSISFGVNGGYFFGKKDYSSRRAIINDSLTYNAANFQTKTTYGNLYLNMGVQYQIKVKTDMFLTLGAYGNMKQKLNARQDVIRETYFYNESSGYVTLDSVTSQRNVKGEITYPSSFTAGFVLEKVQQPGGSSAGWLFGLDYVQNNWEDYRFYGQPEATVRNKWELRAGAQLRPVPKSNYFSNVAYRVGMFIGPDYIQVQNKLPLLGATLGFGLPLRNYNRNSLGQATVINMAFEYIKRGNNDNLLKENLFRISLGFSLSDFWFVKKKYD